MPTNEGFLVTYSSEKQYSVYCTAKGTKCSTISPISFGYPTRQMAEEIGKLHAKEPHPPLPTK